MNEKPSAKAVSPQNNYQNNPFFVATDGIDKLFKKAMPIGILFAIFSFVALLGSLPGSFTPPQMNQESDTTMTQGPLTNSSSSDRTSPTSERSTNVSNPEQIKEAQDNKSFPVGIAVGIGVVVLVVLLVATFVGIVLKGVSDYTASQLAYDKEVGLGQAFRAVFGSFWSYTWVLLIVGVKIFLWSLLFIIPGIIMAVRYALAGVSFFDDKGKGNAAVKDSLALTKGAWLTTFASHSLFNMITFGAVQMLLEPGTNSVLYRQFRPLTDAGQVKPKAHPLSWLALALVLLFVLLIIGIVLLAVFALANYAMSTAP